MLREEAPLAAGQYAKNSTWANLVRPGGPVGGNGVTTEISDQPPAQPPNCASWCDRAVLARQRALTAVSTLLRNRPFALISVELWQPRWRAGARSSRASSRFP